MANENKYTPIDKLQDSNKYNYNMNMENYIYSHQSITNQMKIPFPLNYKNGKCLEFANFNKKSNMNKSCDRKFNIYSNNPYNKEKKNKNKSPFDDLIKFD